MQKLAILFLSLMCINCKSNSNSKIGILKVNKIQIVDKTNLSPNFGTVVITDSNIIQSIINETNKLTPYNDTNYLMGKKQPAVKNSFGFFEVHFYSNNKETEVFQIVYTVYDGIIITKNNNELYKNDALELYIKNIVSKFSSHHLSSISPKKELGLSPA